MRNMRKNVWAKYIAAGAHAGMKGIELNCAMAT